MAAYFFSSPVDVEVKLEDEEARKIVEVKGDKDAMVRCPVYYDGEPVSGQVRPFSVLLPVEIPYFGLYYYFCEGDCTST